MAKQTSKAMSERGRKGGLATYSKYGSKHMSTIGAAGAASFYRLYRIVPYGFGDYAIIRKANNRCIAFLSGHPATFGK